MPRGMPPSKQNNLFPLSFYVSSFHLASIPALRDSSTDLSIMRIDASSVALIIYLRYLLQAEDEAFARE